ncbi:hypothetical protein L195_g027428 [Trifolium pratense]|uniref:Uncharacterized protein n=1 Tax=Trifolium pratense TaxID=57577 RepID=A0A2K3KZ44_TRIPR|nr:hypothetical protein L195_g027428 [Trifolium pratense]
MTIHEPEKQTETQSHPQNPDSSENRSNSDPHKKTRDLPNLTECHGCGFKIDVCTGRNRLRPLYSEWRVVLLCSEFSVCVDCWVPKHMEIARRRRLRKIKSGRIEKKGKVDVVKESSRVLSGGNLIRSVADVVKEATNDVKKKLEAAARAREVAIKRAVAARRAVELANNALSLVANREKSTLNLPSKIDPVKVVRSSYLAFDLHLNSPTKISKTRCLLNTSSPKKWTVGIDSSCKRSNSRNASGSDNKLSLGSSDSDSSTDLSCPGMGRSDMITRPKDGVCTAKYGVEEDCGLGLDCEQADSDSDEENHYFLKYSRRRPDCCQLKYSRRRPDCCQLKYSRRSDRYSLKYSRRKSDRYSFKYSRRTCLKPKLNS